MPEFSESSKSKLATCHVDLKTLFSYVINERDCIIICGHRGEEEQEEAFREGKTRVHYPYGNHNAIPSNAVDAAPYPVDWNNIEGFVEFAKFVLDTAAMLKDAGHIESDIRWGGDWARTGTYNPEENSKHGINDLDHFERILNDAK